MPDRSESSLGFSKCRLALARGARHRRVGRGGTRLGRPISITGSTAAQTRAPRPCPATQRVTAACGWSACVSKGVGAQAAMSFWSSTASRRCVRERVERAPHAKACRSAKSRAGSPRTSTTTRRTEERRGRGFGWLPSSGGGSWVKRLNLPHLDSFLRLSRPGSLANRAFPRCVRSW